MPASPHQDFEDNGSGWCIPSDRGMKFQDVNLETEDKVMLHGWHITHTRFDQPRDTVVFMHENEGNLGQRLEYFELLVKKINVNVLCIAYRGYSKSKGTPSELGL